MSLKTLSPRVRFRVWSLVVFGALAGALIGCQRKTQDVKAPPPPTIPVSKLVKRKITDYAEYTGRTDAVESVTIKPLVTGEIRRLHFTEGSDVRGPVKLLGATLRPGDLLFTINPDPYQAAYDQADGQLALYKAQKVLAEVNYAQDKQGYDAGAVSIFQMNQDKATIDQADARIKSAEATLKSARINLDFCTIRAPISGTTSRYFLTTGNLVSANSTMLTTIVTMNQMYAYFDVEARTMQRIQAGMTAANTKVPVRMELEGDENKAPYPYAGELNFVNNLYNASTGTLALRAVFNNVRSPSGMWRMRPGDFVRIRLELGAPYESALVIDKAIGSDQGNKFLYVVGDKNKVQSRRIVTGSLQEDGLRAIEPYQPKSDKNPIETGVKEDELIVVGGLPQLRPNLEIKPEVIPMPTNANDATQRGRPQPAAPGSETKPAEKKTGDKKPGDKTPL